MFHNHRLKSDNSDNYRGWCFLFHTSEHLAGERHIQIDPPQIICIKNDRPHPAIFQFFFVFFFGNFGGTPIFFQKTYITRTFLMLKIFFGEQHNIKELLIFSESDVYFLSLYW